MDDFDLLQDQMTEANGISPAAPSVSDTDTDDFELPFESLDEYSDAPLEFEELARTLRENLYDTYLQAIRYNHHSPH